DGGGSWFSRNRFLLIGAVVMALVVGVAGWWFLVGRFESVPDVVGLSPEAASEQIRGAGLVVDLSEETVYSDEGAAGAVGDTEPGADERLSPGDQVTVLLSKGPQEVSMPELVCTEVANALKDLKDLGFDEESIVQEEQDSPDSAPGEVLGTSPEAGEQA